MPPRLPRLPRPGRAAKCRAANRQLTNDTTLQWQANTEPNVAGYEVVWRDTSAPLWTHAVRVGNVTTYTFPGCPKTTFFSASARWIKRGNRSIVAFPPSRPLNTVGTMIFRIEGFHDEDRFNPDNPLILKIMVPT